MRLIDADALIKEIDNEMFSTESRKCWEKMRVRKMPTIDAEPVRHGRWIPQDNTFTRYMCSECEGKNHGGHEKYCPSCGAKMDLEVQDGENSEERQAARNTEELL